MDGEEDFLQPGSIQMRTLANEDGRREVKNLRLAFDDQTLSRNDRGGRWGVDV